MKVYWKKLDQWYNPEHIFISLFGKMKYAFWLDSSKVEKDLARFSYMGEGEEKLSYSVEKKEIWKERNGKQGIIKESIFSYLERELKECSLLNDELPFDFVGGFVGYFGYEMYKETMPVSFLTRSGIYQIDSRFRGNDKGESKNDVNNKVPDAYFFFVKKFLAFDHEKREVYAVCLEERQAEVERWFEEIEKKFVMIGDHKKNTNKLSKKVTFKQSRNHRQYIQDIKKCQEYLRKGESYQICLTNQTTAKADIDCSQLYLTLRQINPAPYSAFLRFGEFAILSSSPEMFLKIDKERVVTSKPIKGTVKRGKTKEEDLKLARNLGKTEKDYAENIMIVDLVRNDLGKVCKIGSVKVPKLLAVETYSTVHQLVSTITGKLQDKVSVIDAIKAAFPGGSMTGAPKLRAMEIINHVEKQKRGIYSGALGFLSLNGTMELSIVIRTIITTKKKVQFGTGGAVLLQSDAESEYNEMLLKGKALREAITFIRHSGKL